mgnify:FL=1
MNKDELIVKNIINCIKELDLITKDKDENFFYNDTNEFNRIINQIIKVGEYLSEISDETKSKYPNIYWNVIKDKAEDDEKVGHVMNVGNVYDLLSKILKEELYEKLNEIVRN